MSKQPQEFNASKSNFGTRGWIFVLYSLLVFFIVTAAGDSIKNLSLPELCEAYGWNYTNLVSLTSVFGWITIIFMAFFGQLLRKVSPTKGAIVLGIIETVCIFIYPNVTAVWQFVICFFLICVIGSVWPQQFNAIITSNWFPRKKGLVIGWTTIGLPVGSGLGVLCYNTISSHVGMAGTYYIYGAIMAVAVLVCIIFVRDYPEQCGCFPDNDTSMTRAEADRILAEGIAMSKKSMWTNGRLLRTKEVWLLGISCGIMLLFAGGFMGQMVPRLLAAGYEQMQAVMMMTVAALIGGVGSYVVGFIDTKVGPKKTIILVHTIAIIACILNVIPNTICVTISLVFIGVVLGGAANCLLSMVSTMWGRYAFTNAYGVLLPINQVVGSSGTILVAQMAARFSYNGAYIIVGCLAVVGILLILPVKENSIRNYEIAAGEHAPDEVV